MLLQIPARVPRQNMAAVLPESARSAGRCREAEMVVLRTGQRESAINRDAPNRRSGVRQRFLPVTECSFHCLPLDERYPPLGAVNCVRCCPWIRAQIRLLCAQPQNGLIPDAADKLQVSYAELSVGLLNSS